MEWTPVDKELPESIPQKNRHTRKEDILIRNKNGFNYLGWYDNGFWLESEQGAYLMGIESISHWMKIEPPEDK